MHWHPTEPLKGHGLQFLDIISFERNTFHLNEILFRGNKILFRGNEILFRSNEILFRGNEILFRGNEIDFIRTKSYFEGMKSISFPRNTFRSKEIISKNCKPCPFRGCVLIHVNI